MAIVVEGFLDGDAQKFDKSLNIGERSDVVRLVIAKRTTRGYFNIEFNIQDICILKKKVQEVGSFAICNKEPSDIHIQTNNTLVVDEKMRARLELLPICVEDTKRRKSFYVKFKAKLLHKTFARGVRSIQVGDSITFDSEDVCVTPKASKIVLSYVIDDNITSTTPVHWKVHNPMPIMCTRCGSSVGGLYDEYIGLKVNLDKRLSGDAALKAIGCYRPCCRIAVMTHKDETYDLTRRIAGTDDQTLRRLDNFSKPFATENTVVEADEPVFEATCLCSYGAAVDFDETQTGHAKFIPGFLHMTEGRDPRVGGECSGDECWVVCVESFGKMSAKTLLLAASQASFEYVASSAELSKKEEKFKIFHAELAKLLK
tara:strand:+ start:111 stop:1223 length:1113 start_codon:yes stop_codon:yes gene_type:complete